MKTQGLSIEERNGFGIILPIAIFEKKRARIFSSRKKGLSPNRTVSFSLRSLPDFFLSFRTWKKKGYKVLTHQSKIELLSPAGSYEALQAAIQAGADAVYFGLEELNMRARAAKRFEKKDLPQIVTLCQENKVQSYLALNTLLYDQDLDRMRSLCDLAKETGVSAIIASDIAAMQYARSIDLDVHISTQTNISNIEAVRFYSRFADVMVLARELNIEQIRHIHREIQQQALTGPNGKPIRLELFIHGALCVSVSGRCYMSLANYNHSANRGDCFQTCRRKYRVIDEETGQELVVDNQFVMSPQDLCTIEFLDQLIGAGATVLKIEGRGRAADYVYQVTRSYREAIDSIAEGSFTREKTENWMERLSTVFNRGFWRGGYYLGNPLEGWSAAEGSKATEEKTLAGLVVNYYKNAHVVEATLNHQPLSIGDKVMIIGKTSGYIEFCVQDLFLDDAPVTHAPKGSRITLKLEQRVRAGDKLYIVKKRTEQE